MNENPGLVIKKLDNAGHCENEIDNVHCREVHPLK